MKEDRLMKNEEIELKEETEKENKTGADVPAGSENEETVSEPDVVVQEAGEEENAAEGEEAATGGEEPQAGGAEPVTDEAEPEADAARSEVNEAELEADAARPEANEVKPEVDAARSEANGSEQETAGEPAEAVNAEAVNTEKTPEAEENVTEGDGAGGGADRERPSQGSLDPADIRPVTTEPRKKRSAGKIAFLISLLIILAGLGGAYYYGYQYCGTHFMPGTRINTFDCSNLTEEEVEARFAEAAEHYVVNIRFRGGNTEMLSAQDMGFEYKPDGSVAALLQQQDQLMWPKYFFEDSGYDIEVGGSYDPEKLMAALQALPELQKDNMEEPENAYIQFRSGNETEDGVFEIVPDTAGSKIDADQLAAGVGDAAARYEEMVDAEQVAGAYLEAEIKADNADIVSRCKELNEIVGASITYVMPDGMEIKLNSDVMVNWLVKDEKGRLVKDDDVWDENLWAFMQELANNGNTLGMKRQFNSTLRGQITVSGGDYGYMVNQIVEHDLLLEDLPANKKETRKPSYYLTPYNEETENDGIGTSYIEVDLAAQHIWCYVDGELKMDSDCVSGMTSDGHATPTGVFGIMFMKKDATLRGIMQKNGEYEYETKVSYWMPFYNDCGFHDAWWRTAFGGNIYVNDGSHGCINLPVDAAEELFKYCDEKMPVVVYE